MRECCLSSLRRGPTCLATLLGNTGCQRSCIGLASPRKEGRQSASPLLTQGLLSRDSPHRKPAPSEGRGRRKEGRERTTRKSKGVFKASTTVSLRVGLDLQGQQIISVWEDSWQKSEDNLEHAFSFSQNSSHHLAMNPHHNSVSVFEMDINVSINLLSLGRSKKKKKKNVS